MSNVKTGLDYFPLDVDFFNDEKIEFISAKFGILGEIITIKLLARIYRNGYYLKWGEDECLLFSKKAGEGINVETIQEVVQELFTREFLDEKLYKKYNILSSRGIQKRYIEATKRRKNVSVVREYLLIDKHDIEHMPPNVSIITMERQVEKKQEDKANNKEETNNKKEKQNSPFEETWRQFVEMRKKIKKPMTDKAKELILAKLNKMASSESEKIAILNQSIMNSWQGVFPLKDTDNIDSSPPKYTRKEEPKLTPEEIQKNRAKLKELMGAFEGKFSIPKDIGEG